VLTPLYTADFNEVKALGCMGCAARTAEQTEIALFWMENIADRLEPHCAHRGRPAEPGRVGRCAAVRGAGRQRVRRLYREPRVKYFYNFWRPVTAVALAGTDNNPATASAAGWEVLAFPTPPVPDYPSAHSTAGGAAAGRH
jgi:hypothetical protein